MVLLLNTNVLKSLFKVRRFGFEDEQAKLDRYYRYFEKMDGKQYDLIQELHLACSENPSIDVHVQELVNNLHELVCGGADG